MDLTFTYEIDNVYIRHSYVGAGSSVYSGVIEQIKYSITGTHSDGRSASVTNICTLPLGNTGYLGYTDYTDVTKSDLVKLVKVDIEGTPQQIQNIADIEKAINSQVIPDLTEVNISS